MHVQITVSLLKMQMGRHDWEGDISTTSKYRVNLALQGKGGVFL